MRSIRLRLTLGMVLVLSPFLFVVTHLLMAVHAHAVHVPGRGDQALLYKLCAISILTFGIGTWLIIGRTLSPIAELTEQARQAEPDGSSRVLHASSDDREVVELVATLNELLGRVSEAAESKGRFYAAASHELRNPLQGLIGHLELAASRPRTAEEYQATVCEALEQANRLSSIVQGVLMLHRLETEGKQAVEAVEVLSVLDRCAAEASVNVEWINRSDFTVSSVPSHLEILFQNLFRNAVQHGEPPIQLEVGDRRVTLANRIPPGVPIDLEELREPFAASNRSRRASHGNGLGVAICQAVCRSNGWSLTYQVQERRLAAVVDFRPSTAESASGRACR